MGLTDWWSRRHGLVRAAGILLVLPALGGGLVGLAMSGLFAESGGSATSGSIAERPQRLKSIPIPAGACPYLKAVHDTSATAADVWLNAPATWGTAEFNRRLAPTLGPFELSLRASATQVPAPLRAELVDTATQVAVGRALLAHTDPSSTRALIDAMLAGVTSLGNATDLVGNACGFLLAPDSFF